MYEGSTCPHVKRIDLPNEFLSHKLTTTLLQQVLAYNSANPQFWPPRIRVLDTDLTLSNLYTDAQHLEKHPEGCHSLVQAAELHASAMNLTTSDLLSMDSGELNRTQQGMMDSWTPEKDELLKLCAESVRRYSPGVSKLLEDLLVHLADRNGYAAALFPASSDAEIAQ